MGSANPTENTAASSPITIEFFASVRFRSDSSAAEYASSVNGRETS